LVGVHLKSMRANMLGLPLLRALTEGEGLGGARLRIDVHREIWEPQAPAFRGDLRTPLEHLAGRDALDLHVHDYFSDLELYDYLAGLDVAILPYRFGTHSGWLEACRDLGTSVVAPSCGSYADQGPAFIYQCDEAGLDAASLRGAVRRAASARDEGDPERTSPQFVREGSPSSLPRLTWRRTQRERIAEAHEALYRRVLAELRGVRVEAAAA
jgi:hypothetical protein